MSLRGHMAVYCKDGIPVQFVWPALGQPSRGVSPLKLAKKIKRTYVSIQLRGLSRLSTAVTQRLFGCAGSVNKGLNARRKRNNNGVEELSAKRSRNDVDDVVMVPENELDLADLFDGV